jgi:hypothetical protein
VVDPTGGELEMRRSALIAVLAVILTVPTGASAQDGGPGFLFKRPVVSLGIRAGYAVPRAGGELFDFTLDEFIPSGADTLSSLSFDSPYLGGEIAIRPRERWDIAVGFGWSRSRTISEYRWWVDSSDNPIEQETTFQVVTGTVGAKYYFQDRGRSVGTLTWVPRRLTPFVGTGIGVSSYEFLQEGDFLDSKTLEVLPDFLESSGEGFIWYASVGADLVLANHAVLTGEVRYSLSNAGVQGSYVGFGDMDLGGLQLMVGMGFQF